MATTAEILEHYRVLTDYCDAFWSRVVRALPGQITCHRGCTLCCELPSVNHLEALIIVEYCKKHRDAPGADEKTSQTAPQQNGSCPFITDGSCRIYEVRPLICRTHGLLLRDAASPHPVSLSCPKNFTGIDLAAIDNTLVLDIETISDNLARLNAAFCLLHGTISKASDRVPMRDLAGGTANGLFTAFQQGQS